MKANMEAWASLMYAVGPTGATFFLSPPLSLPNKMYLNLHTAGLNDLHLSVGMYRFNTSERRLIWTVEESITIEAEFPEYKMALGTDDNFVKIKFV